MLALGTSFVLLLFALSFDAGELSWLSRHVNYYRFLEKEGFECKTEFHELKYRNHTYPHHDCYCMKGQKIGKCVEYACLFLYRTYKKMGNRALECSSTLNIYCIYRVYKKNGDPFK